jgi:hypothetical protein
MKQNQRLSTIVWVPIPIWLNFLRESITFVKKLSNLSCDNLWNLALVWRVERLNSWFLAIQLVEIDGLSTFGHSVKRPLWYKGHFTHETESPWWLHFKHPHSQRRQSQSKFALHYAWGTYGICEYQDRWKVCMDPYMAPNGLCFMVTWIIFKNHLLEVGLPQNWETMALRILTTVDSFYVIMCEDLHK